VSLEPAVRIGVDLGGTATRVVAVRPDGSVAADRVVATAALGATPRDGVTSLVGMIEAVGSGLSVAAVGIGASGPIDSSGIIRNRDTLPNLTGISVPAAVEEQLGVSASIDNDSVAFALGERRFGAGRGASSIIGVTLGTGIGAAYVDDAGPLRGGDGVHPEGGHIAVPSAPDPCYCGLASCWEQAGSRRALERLVERDRLYPDVESAAVDARAGSGEAMSVFSRYGDGVSSGLVTLCGLFRPECVVIGGGAAAYSDLFLERATRGLERAEGYETTRDLRVSKLGVLAGAIGAACLQSAGPLGDDVETTMEAQWPRSR
jgi:glucokinase